jgi:hypothetical protein
MNAKAMSAIRVKRCVAAVAIVIGLLSQACANYQARVADGSPLDTEYDGGMMNAYAWGVWVSPEIRSAEACKNGMYDVVVENNYFYGLASTLTLGFWMPMDVSYRCQAPGVTGGGEVPP